MKIDFTDIAPFSDEEVKNAINELKHDDLFFKGVQFFYPDWSINDIKSKLNDCKSCSDFQVQFIEQIIKRAIRHSMDEFKIIGLNQVDATHSLFLSNHRDIFLDAALLQNHLYDIGLPFTEISLGDNLMINSTFQKVAKLNNMFTVLRSGSKSSMIRNTVNLSHYLRHAITEKKVSAWIAHRNGRTKDGHDVTAPGLIKMLLISGGDDTKEAIESLNLVISTVSYEYEPCAFAKAEEFKLLKNKKVIPLKEKRDLNSIVKGINDYKGKVSLVFEKFDLNQINFTNNTKDDAKIIAKAIDRVMYRNYQIHKTNYMAYDLYFKSTTYRTQYTLKDLDGFKAYLNQAKDNEIYSSVLKMYVNPLLNKEAMN